MYKRFLLPCFYTILFFSFSIVLSTSCSRYVEPPAPYGATPTAHQLEWQKMEYYMFIHFGPNTFTDVEWGDGKEDPKVFNPTNLDCRQWAKIAKDAGMKAIVITAKHHDGFCLWPSQYSTHTVRESLWKDGKGDLLRELSDACKEYGLKFGVYLSPWDQNHPTYGSPEYNQVFANTLTEVLAGYGPVFEQWFDGANGDAHKGKRQEYDWDLFHNTVYTHQPHAVIFSDVGPGCRWMGNEKGIAGETNWSRLNIKGFEPGFGAPPTDTLSKGNIYGEAWVPAETDVSIRPGWFYSPRTDGKVKTLNELINIYYSSVGRNSNLLLNVPPDRKGRIHPTDSARLMEFSRFIDLFYKNNLLERASLRAINTRGDAPAYEATNLLNGDYNSYWAADDDVTSTAIEITLPQAQTFNRFLIQEYIPLGQRVAKFALETWNESSANWDVLAEGTTIGYKRILRFPKTTAKKLRLNIQESLACPVLNSIALYDVQESYKGKSEIADEKRLFDISSDKWNVVSPQVGESIKRIIDGFIQTGSSILQLLPIEIDLGETLSLKGFTYIPSNSSSEPAIMRYNFYVSEDGKEWIPVKKEAMFNNIKNNPIQQDVLFDAPVNAKYIKFEPIETTLGGLEYIVAELGVITKL
ncbi:MAG: alpha-L-fucosidase [Tannerellaceae bacterium]|jgi:alpha-L-fucosidase|nr:alpha-L-fucosidase [Tannerellaceae bacterium]